MGIIALVTLGGCGLAGWILGQLFRILRRCSRYWPTGQRPPGRRRPDRAALGSDPGRIALALEERDGSAGLRPATATSAASVSAKAVRTELAAAQAAGRAGRVIELGDSLTQHLRGEPLHALDRELALWMLNLVERRVQSGTVDVEVAGWVARALDSFECEAEAGSGAGLAGPAPSRGIMPEMRAARRGQEVLCSDCRSGAAVSRTVPDSSAQSSSTRERP